MSAASGQGCVCCAPRRAACPAPTTPASHPSQPRITHSRARAHTHTHTHTPPPQALPRGGLLHQPHAAGERPRREVLRYGGWRAAGRGAGHHGGGCGWVVCGVGAGVCCGLLGMRCWTSRLRMRVGGVGAALLLRLWCVGLGGWSKARCLPRWHARCASRTARGTPATPSPPQLTPRLPACLPACAASCPLPTPPRPPACPHLPPPPAEGMRAQARARTQYHWDKRSKKYVKLQAGETIKAGKRVKTESGAKVGPPWARPAGCAGDAAGMWHSRQPASLQRKRSCCCLRSARLCPAQGRASEGRCRVLHPVSLTCLPAVGACLLRACCPCCLGVQGSKGATGIYQKWAKKTRLRVASGGTEEQSSALAAQVADRWAATSAPCLAATTAGEAGERGGCPVLAPLAAPAGAPAPHPNAAASGARLAPRPSPPATSHLPLAWGRQLPHPTHPVALSPAPGVPPLPLPACACASQVQARRPWLGQPSQGRGAQRRRPGGAAHPGPSAQGGQGGGAQAGAPGKGGRGWGMGCGCVWGVAAGCVGVWLWGVSGCLWSVWRGVAVLVVVV